MEGEEKMEDVGLGGKHNWAATYRREAQAYRRVRLGRLEGLDTGLCAMAKHAHAEQKVSE